ncbi:MAG: 6-phosphofructokinase [Sandaracinaceae bacterium]|nr:6-phosphofructokinase [Sandaracinaceae bacterium]
MVGVERGYQGLLDDRVRPLTRSTASGAPPTSEVEVAASLGGSFLGTARCKAFYEPRAARGPRRAGALRGPRGDRRNGSLAGAHALATEHGAQVIGVPASIDHDIGCTYPAIGVDSALNTIVEACDRIMTRRARAARLREGGDGPAERLPRHGGRDRRGRGTRRSSASRAVRGDAIVRDVAAVIRRELRREDRDKQRVLILKAEGVEVPCTKLVRRVQEELGDSLGDVSIRATVLGHLVRGGSPSFADRMAPNRFGHAAV